MSNKAIDKDYLLTQLKNLDKDVLEDKYVQELDIKDTYNATSEEPISGKGVKAAIDTLDVTGTNSFGAGKTISSWSETDGKVSITSQNIEITKSQISDLSVVTTLANDNTVPTGSAVKTYVDSATSGIAGYQGTVTALTGLSKTAKKGDFYRVSTAWTGVHVGDVIIAEKNNPSQTIDGTNWSLLHNDLDTDTTYSFATGSTEGAFSVTPSRGSAISVSINGWSDLKKSVSDGKSSVASAITNQGVTTAADATFATIATNIGTVATNKYNAGKTDYNPTNATLSNAGALTVKNAAGTTRLTKTFTNSYDAGVNATKVGTAAAADVRSGKTFTNSSSIGANGSMPNATITSGSASITSETFAYNSKNDNFDVTGSATVSAPSVGTAGYISSSEGTKKTNTATLKTTVAKVGIKATNSGTTTKTPVISRVAKPSADTWTDGASGAATTIKPTSGVYVEVQSAANTGTLTSTPSVSNAGYGTTTSGQYTATNATSTVGANASAATYIPIKIGSATTPTASAASTSTSLNGTTITVARNVTPTVSDGWVSSGTAGTVTTTATVPTQTKTVNPSTSSKTVSPDSGKLLSSVTVEAMSNGSLNNAATAGVTYTENTAASTVIPSEGALYINAGYIPNTKITLGHMIPDPETGKNNAGAAAMRSNYVAYDKDGKKIVGTIADVTPSFTGGGASLTGTSNTISTNMKTATSGDYYIDATAKAKATRTAVTYNGATTGYINIASGTSASASNTSTEQSITANRIYVPKSSVPNPTISIDSAGKITATSTHTAGYNPGGTASNTKQMTVQTAKTVAPTSSAQTVVTAGTYCTGDVIVSAVNTEKIMAVPGTSNKTIPPSSGKFISEVKVLGVNIPNEALIAYGSSVTVSSSTLRTGKMRMNFPTFYIAPSHGCISYSTSGGNTWATTSYSSLYDNSIWGCGNQIGGGGTSLMIGGKNTSSSSNLSVKYSDSIKGTDFSNTSDGLPTSNGYNFKGRIIKSLNGTPGVGGNNGKLYYLMNGITSWASVVKIAKTDYYSHMYGITYGNGLYITCGGHSYTDGINSGIYYSSSLSTSSISAAVTSTSVMFYDAVYASGRFFVTTGTKTVYTSTDGKTWSTITAPANVYYVSYGCGKTLFFQSEGSTATSYYYIKDGTTSFNIVNGGFAIRPKTVFYDGISRFYCLSHDGKNVLYNRYGNNSWSALSTFTTAQEVFVCMTPQST